MLGWVLALGLVAGVVSGADASTNTPITLGLLLPPEEPLRPSILAGARLAAKRFEASGGVRLVVRGRVGQWGDDGGEAGRLVLEDEVQVLIGPPAGVPAHLVLQVAGRTRTPVVLLSSETSVTDAGIPWALRVVPSTAAELGALLGEGRTRVLVPEGRSARELGLDVERWLRGRPAGGPSAQVKVHAVPAESMAVGERRGVPSEAVARLLAEPADTLLVWLDPEPAAAWVRGLRAAGFRGRLAGPGWLRCPGFVRAAGEAAVGFELAGIDPGSSAGEVRVALREFVRDYRETVGEEPDAAAVAAADAVGVAVALVRKAAGGVVAGGFPVGDLGTGLTGPWQFDRSGNREARLRRVHWTSRGWRVVGGE